MATVGALVGAALVGFFSGEASYLMGMTTGITFILVGLGVVIGGFAGLGLGVWAYEAPWKSAT